MDSRLESLWPLYDDTELYIDIVHFLRRLDHEDKMCRRTFWRQKNHPLYFMEDIVQSRCVIGFGMTKDPDQTTR